PVSTPVYPAVTYSYPDTAILSDVLGFERPGYCYTRYGNPTVAALEKAVATLEGADDAVAFSSGMAALHLALAQAGVSHDTPVVAAADLYGATRTLLKQMHPQADGVTLVDVTDTKSVIEAIERTKPRVLLVEIISNPLLKIADLPTMAEA